MKEMILAILDAQQGVNFDYSIHGDVIRVELFESFGDMERYLDLDDVLDEMSTEIHDYYDVVRHVLPDCVIDIVDLYLDD